MSKEQVEGIDKEETSSQDEGSAKDDNEEYVPRKSYEEVTKDMHKYKQNFKELKARLNEYESKLKSHEEEKLKEQQKWQELYERAKKEKEDTVKARQKERDMYLKSVKLSALKNELGGKIKDIYLSHADISSIDISEDGVINPESLRSVANDFRKEHGQLIPKDGSGNITSQAPRSSQAPAGDKPLSEMTIEEKKAALRKLRLEQQN